MPAVAVQTNRTCETCRFFNSENGECRVNPPLARCLLLKDEVASVLDDRPFWPKTMSSDTCGRWHDRDHPKLERKDVPPGWTHYDFHRQLYGGNLADCSNCLETPA